jgi:uncharacterized membrane protein
VPEIAGHLECYSFLKKWKERIQTYALGFITGVVIEVGGVVAAANVTEVALWQIVHTRGYLIGVDFVFMHQRAALYPIESA